MRKSVLLLILVTFICAGVGTVSAFTVFDPINHATSLLRNAILQAQQVENLLEAGKRLLELKNLVKEFEFFNQKLIDSGFGEIGNLIQKFRTFVGDSGKPLLPFEEEESKTYFKTVQQNPYFQGTASQVAQIEFSSARAESGATTLPYYLTLVPDPLSPNHPYITYEQGQIARTFDDAEALREYAGELAKDGADLEEAAAQATYDANPLDESQWIKMSIVHEDALGKPGGKALRLDYDVDSWKQARAEFWIDLEEKDFSTFDTLSLWLHGDPQKRFTKSVTLRFKDGDNQTAPYIVSGIKKEWKEFQIPFKRFSRIRDWSHMKEFSLIFDDVNSNPKEGSLYIDEIRVSKERYESHNEAIGRRNRTG